jgi:hypothetical protein
MLTCPDRPRFLPAVERALGRTATVIQALAGGTHARTWLIQVGSPELTLILREFPPGDDAAATETRILGALDGLNGMAPQLVASDSSTASAAGSWTLISRLPGIADLRPAPPARLAEQLGHVLARIHAFLASYEAASGAALADPLLWDLWAAARSHENVQTWVPNYHDLGRPDLTARELRRRHDAWTTYLLEHRLDH